MKKILRLVLADLKEVQRNKGVIFWTFMFPLIFIGIFGLVYGNEDIPPMHVGLAVEDHSEDLQPLVEAIKGIDLLDIEEGEQQGLLDELQDGDLTAVVVLDAQFSADFVKQDAEIVVMYDPANQTSANIVVSALSGAMDGINQFLTKVKDPITVTQQSIETERTRQIDWLVPGILGMSIMQLGLFSSAALVTLREKKIFRRFAVTPLRREHVVVSQVLFRLIFGVIQSLVLLLAGYLLYKTSIRGNLFVLLIVVVESLMMFLAMGYIAASIAKNEEVVEPIVQVFAMPMMFLSGTFFPIDMMPEFIRPVVQALPLTHVNDALRAVINHADGLSAIGGELGVIGIWLLVCMAIAVKIFRWD